MPDGPPVEMISPQIQPPSRSVCARMIFTVSILGLPHLSMNTAEAADHHQQQSDITKPHVLFIAIDDLNDWIGCLKTHAQVSTPNIDRLANRGRLFTNAHVQATFCGPSRLSLLSGRFPFRTGAYGFEPTYDKQPHLQGLPSLPAWLQRHGYRTVGGGKIYHQGIQQGTVGGFDIDLGHGSAAPKPKQPLNWHVPIWDFGPFPERDEQVENYQMALAAAQELQAEQTSPLFLAVGFRRPHVPLYAPPRWFEKYPLETLQMPNAPLSDLDDVPTFAKNVALTDQQIAPTHAEVLQKQKWAGFVQAYLACISFTDHCVGILLDSLEKSPLRDNTIVVVWSDHGWHLGEKQHWAKRTLWEETTRVPLIIAGPGIAPGACGRPVMLLDLFPTLCEICDVPPREKLDGTSLMPLLKDSNAQWNSPALTSLDPGSHSVRTEHWRYIRYADGSEELYDHRRDPDEWRNLANDPAFSERCRELAAALPRDEIPAVTGIAAGAERSSRARQRPRDRTE